MADSEHQDVTTIENPFSAEDCGTKSETEHIVQPTSESRIRTLTEKGKEAYIDRKEKYVQDIEFLWTMCDAMLQETTSAPADKIKALELEQKIVQAYSRYGKYKEEYRIYLTGQRTEISNRDMEDFIVISDIRKQLFDAAIAKLKSAGQVPIPTRSTKSHKSGSRASSRSGSVSTRSSTSSLAKRTRAKAEALKASIQFAEQQMAIEKQQAELKERAIREETELKQRTMELKQRAIREEAELQAEKTFLELKKEAAAADAEARAYEHSDHGDFVSELPIETEDPKQRVIKYVNQQADEVQNLALHTGNTGIFPVATSEQVEMPNPVINVVSGFNPVSTVQTENQNIPRIQTGPKYFDTMVPFDQNITSTVQSLNYGLPSVTSTPFQPRHETRTSYPEVSILNRDAPVFVPSPPEQSYQIHQPAGEITKFLLRKDLLFSRLTNYDDRPEAYYAWKASFKCITEVLSVTDSEQIDLMVKWLGPESAKQARSIRACNAENPSTGLKLLWKRLDERYGSPEMTEASLKKKLENFPKLSNKDHQRLYELSDILSEIQCIKVKPKFKNLLAYYGSSAGVKPVVAKLPYGLQEKWTTRAARYKIQYDVAFPPFTEFCTFIEEMSLIKNDPGFCVEQEPYQKPKGPVARTTQHINPRVNVRKTDVNKRQENSSQVNNQQSVCIIHGDHHPMNDCKSFRAKSLKQRKELLRVADACFRCCSKGHSKEQCKSRISCKDCGSKFHTTAMHIDRDDKQPETTPTFQHGGERKPRSLPVKSHGGEESNDRRSTPEPSPEVKSICTEICGQFSGKSCAKILPVEVYHKDHSDKIVKMYAIIDEQSNRTMAPSEFFDIFNVQGNSENYTSTTCSGKSNVSGRRATGFIVRSMTADKYLELPAIVECDYLPSNREEIPSPEVIRQYTYLAELSDQIMPIDDKCHIMLLIGRDLLEAHHIGRQIYGPPNMPKSPFAQHLKLGWVIIGETCLDKQHPYTEVSVKKTSLLSTGRATIMAPCTNEFKVRENITYEQPFDDLNLFVKTSEDDKPGMSYEDKVFMEVMDEQFQIDQNGSWVAPLPFRQKRQRLPNNIQRAVHRAKLLDDSLQKNPTKREHFLAFMEKILDNNHAEVAPSLHKNEECWYLPLFGVYHPKKPDHIRGVFDSSAKHNGVSLNDVLLSGPDLANSLLGVLLRFRKEMVAVAADIQHMFHCFIVRNDHRNYLRFLWHEDNNLDKPIIEYRMRVHVFGNSPSPAVATLGLRKTAQASEEKYGSHVTDFVTKDFYVDDGLTSCPTAEDAIKVMKDTQAALKEYGNLRLHKIASNSQTVMSAFPAEDLASNLKDLDLESNNKPLQRSLGIIWDVNTDKFLFKLSLDDKPITKRGILSTVNSIFDPLGFLAPVIIRGKLLQRKYMNGNIEWDAPVTSEIEDEWMAWRNTLKDLESLKIPRTCVTNLSEAKVKELHVYSDASEKAIAAVVYIRTVDNQDNENVGFVLGKAKVAPTSGHTIPRLELCAAVLAVEIAQCALDNLDLKIDMIKYYTDSKVVLGYISNETRRFYIYVANRVERIRQLSDPTQWNYVPSEHNPADCATRSIAARDIHVSNWLSGPKQLRHKDLEDSHCEYDLVEPDIDAEIRPVSVLKVKVTCENLESPTEWMERYSEWTKLIAVATLVRRFAYKRKLQTVEALSIEDNTQLTEQMIIKSVQYETYEDEIQRILESRPLTKQSPIYKLNPYLDEHGLLRVGGRIIHADLSLKEKRPLIVPGSHHIATLLIRHYHCKVKHQGRHFTDGAIRAAGLWITSAKRNISSVIHKCVNCRTLRGKSMCQIMAYLPEDRLEPTPPITNVGVDVFGPWTVVSRRTRGGQANPKRWAVLFTCLVTRAVHIELVEEMSSSAFINSARRFSAIRGPVKIFRSDRGTNFIGAVRDLRIKALNVEDGPIKDYLQSTDAIWKFNPAHSSHMEGVWERMIGVARRILDSMLSNTDDKNLTHDVLNTFMAEVSAIINSRPLVSVSTDPESPLILTPAMLLTQKTEYVFQSDELGDFNKKDLYLVEWRRVQALAKMFWTRWRSEYLPLLQQRNKWTTTNRNLKNGDVVLVVDNQVCRNQWPTGVIVNAIPGADGHVRKAEVRIRSSKETKTLTRPITEMVLLLENNSSDA